MPIQYPEGLVKEHFNCRENAAFFDVSHMAQLKYRIYEKNYVNLLEYTVKTEPDSLKNSLLVTFKVMPSNVVYEPNHYRLPRRHWLFKFNIKRASWHCR